MLKRKREERTTNLLFASLPSIQMELVVQTSDDAVVFLAPFLAEALNFRAVIRVSEDVQIKLTICFSFKMRNALFT